MASRFTAIRNPTMPRAMNPSDTRLRWSTGKYSAFGIGAERQRGGAEAIDHAAQRTENVSEEHRCGDRDLVQRPAQQ